jgi:hypothetical protein
MLKQRRENRIVNCLVCWTCHGRMGPNHFTLKNGGAMCGLCKSKNPLGNLRKLSLQEVTEPSEIIVCFTRNGKVAHTLHLDCKTVLAPWIMFASGETLHQALAYLGATDAQTEAHRADSACVGAGKQQHQAAAESESSGNPLCEEHQPFRFS